jgi:uncharacterized membrane protein (UPF0127 family)/Flp pilus assembly protein TadD
VPVRELLAPSALALIVAALAWALQPAQAQAAPVPEAAGQAVVLVTPEQLVEIRVQLGRTPEEWDRGLRGAPPLGPDQGLLLLFPREEVRSFSTRDVTFPIDILLIDRNYRIVDILAGAQGDRTHASPRPVIAALHLRQGLAEEHQVGVGDYAMPRGFEIQAPGKKAASSSAEGNEAVERQLRQNVKKHPGDEEALEALAHFLAAAGKLSEAERLIKKLLAAQRTAERLSALGVVLAMSGRRDQALTKFREAIAADPSNPTGYLQLLRYQASVKVAGEVINEAVTLLKKAVEDDPKFTRGRLILFRLYLSEGRLDEAAALLANQERTPDVIRALGDLELRRGNHLAAADLYLEYLKLRPYDLRGPELRAFITVHKVRAQKEKQ